MKLSLFGQVGLEEIDFQSGIFGKELENVFESILKNDDKDDNSDYIKMVEAIISKRTGLRITFSTNPVGNAYASFDIISFEHIIVPDVYKLIFKNSGETRDSYKKTLNKLLDFKKKNIVDLKNARVSGVFSEFVSNINININYLKKLKYEPRHIVAFLLHEIGHIFTMYEYIDRQTTSNQILESVFKSVINKDSNQQKQIIFKDASLLLDVNEDEFKELNNEEDPKIISSVILKMTANNLHSQLGIGGYDFTSCEQLADQFCNRQGYGRSFIEALDLLSINNMAFEKYKHTKHYINFCQIFTKTAYTTFLLTAFGVGFFSFLFLLIYNSIIASNYGEKIKSYSYDELKTRYLRIRQDCVVYLKNDNLDPKFVKSVLSDLEAIDKIIENTYEYRTVFDIYADFVNPKSRKMRSTYELQRQLENLAMNDFFVKSAALKTL